MKRVFFSWTLCVFIGLVGPFVFPLRGGAFPRAVFQGQEVSLHSEAEVQKIFNEFKANGDLAWNFPEAGCWERTYEMIWVLKQKGISPMKSFMTSERAGLALTGIALIRVEHPFRKGQFLLWHNHVAPVVMVQKDKRLIPFTLDPVLFSRAVPTAEWAQYLRRNSLKGKISLSFLPPTQGSFSGGTRLNYQNEAERQNNRAELRKYRELGEDPEKAAEWYFQKENEELKYGES